MNPAGAPLKAIGLPDYGGMKASKEALKYQILTDHEVLLVTNRRLRAELRKKSQKSKATEKVSC